MIFDGINQSFVGFFRQFNGAILGLLGFFVKCYVDSAEIELGSLQDDKTRGITINDQQELRAQNLLHVFNKLPSSTCKLNLG